jgi:hypothetical protein
MFGIDEWIIHLPGDSFVFVVFVAVLLGLRHATDPDHLSAMLTLRISRQQKFPMRIGAAWGVGHAATMLIVGIPLILLVAELPSGVQIGLEFAVGVMISVLALRAIWASMRFTSHDHKHAHHEIGAHAHIHIHGPTDHDHKIRTPLGALAIGLLHGAGGSAGVVALILGRMNDSWTAIAALCVIAVFSGVSMALLSWAMYRGLDRVAPRIGAKNITMIGGLLTLAFGIWYCAASLEAVWYPF